MPIGNPIQKNNDTRVISATATTGQTDFTVTGGYTINAIGVFRNGVRLNNSTDFTAADGSTVSLNVAADAGDTVTFHIFDKFTVANAIVGAASTQTVYGNLAVNGELYSTNLNPTNVDIAGIGTIAKAIIGTGVTIDQSNIDTVGIISATTFNGSFVGTITGAASQITVADESSDTTCFPTFVTAATGNLPPKSGTNLTFNSSSGALTATSVNGNIVGGTVSGTTGTFSDNVDIADKIVHTGDTNTAIRFPVNDTVSVETAGSEALRVDASGRVLIGTTDEGHADADNLTVSSSTRTGITIRSADDNTGNVFFSDATSGAGEYAGYIQYSHSTNQFLLGTAGVDYLRLDSSGRLKLGTDTEGDSGADNLTIADSGAAGITLRSGTTSTGNIYFSDATSGSGEYDGYIQYSQNTRHLSLGTATLERLRIDSSGRVLINDFGVLASYGGDLQVTNSNVAVNSFAANEHAQTFMFAKSRGTSGSGGTIVQDNDYCGHIEWYADDGENTENQIAKISGRIDGSPGTNDTPGELLFFTTADGANSSTERLRISSTGRLHTQGSEDISMDSSANGQFMVDGNGYGCAIALNDDAMHIYHNSASRDMVFGLNETERARIKATGVVGIGTDAGAASSNTMLTLQTTGSSACRLVLANTGSTSKESTQIYSQNNDFVFNTNANERLRITSGVVASFGNSSPPAWANDTGYYNIQLGKTGYLRSDTDTSNTFMTIGQNAVKESGGWKYAVTAGASSIFQQGGSIFFETAGSGTAGNALTLTEKVRITSYGDVGIGSQTPSDPSWGTEGNTKFLSISGSTYGVLSLEGSNTQHTKFSIGAGDGVLYLAYDENNGQHLVKVEQSTKDLKVEQGNLKIGTNGKGIDFSTTEGGNATASILDDYEYGTFTPTLLGSTALGTISYAAQYGLYVKVGRQVTVYVDMTVNSWSGASGGQRIGGMPFPKAELSGLAYYYEGVSTWYVADPITGTNAHWGGYMGDGQALMNMYVGDTPEIGSVAPVNVAGRISCTWTYTTSS